MAVVLAHPELTYLAAYLGRLRNWDERSAVRMQVRGGVVGLYGSLPMEALALVVVPLAQSAAGTDLDGFDRTVSAGRLRDVIGNPGDDATAVRELRIPDEIAGPASLADLPPRSGWYPGESALARDVVPRVEEAVAAFRSQVPAAGALNAELVAWSTWDGEGWGGVPMRALHAAQLLGFLAHAAAQVRTATALGWTRLVTPAGQVFVRDGGPRDLLRTPPR